jgi:hypothetical protein
VPEKLRYRGEHLSMLTTPLKDYFATGGVDPGFAWSFTSLRRGYVGDWSIEGGRLYLVGLEGTLKDGREASVETVFPGAWGKAFAGWFSGTIRVPQGKVVEYVHLGFCSRYESDLLIEIVKGIVQSDHVRLTAPNDFSSDPWYLRLSTKVQAFLKTNSWDR